MQRRRLLLLATTLLLISAEPGRGSEQPLEPPGGLEGAEDAFMERRPQIQLWIRMRGPYTKYVIASLKKAVTQNGLTCQEISPGGIYLRCQFVGANYTALEAWYEGDGQLRISMAHFHNEEKNVDVARESAIDTAVHTFSREIKQSGKIRRVDRCVYPHTDCKRL
jgi:hypothetical protein